MTTLSLVIPDQSLPRAIPRASSLDDLVSGEVGLIVRIDGAGLARGRLIEMGLTPGVRVRLVRRAPFGDPIEIDVLGNHFAIRRELASLVFVSTQQCTVGAGV